VRRVAWEVVVRAKAGRMPVPPTSLADSHRETLAIRRDAGWDPPEAGCYTRGFRVAGIL
jgi:hypothetical protein